MHPTTAGGGVITATVVDALMISVPLIATSISRTDEGQHRQRRSKHDFRITSSPEAVRLDSAVTQSMGGIGELGKFIQPLRATAPFSNGRYYFARDI